MADRYKKRGLQFNNTHDSRVLRAVNNQQRRRGCRDEVVNSRRQLKDVENSPQVAAPSKPTQVVSDKKAVQYQKGLERYQQLLKWKEIKKKQLEKEKKKRMPAFKTGVYQPSPPKYLVSANQNEQVAKTPLASLKKKPVTPGASLCKVPVFHLGGTPATALLRAPQFHTGVTPGVSSKKQILTARKIIKQEGKGAVGRTRAAHMKESRKVGVRGRVTRQIKADKQEDLGVCPLPLTPPVTVPKKVEKTVSFLRSLPRPSFAPPDFAFKFEAPQIPKTEYSSSICPGDSVMPQDNIINKRQDNELDDCVKGDAPKEEATTIESDKHFMEENEGELHLERQDDLPCVNSEEHRDLDDCVKEDASEMNSSSVERDEHVSEEHENDKYVLEKHEGVKHVSEECEGDRHISEEHEDAEHVSEEYEGDEHITEKQEDAEHVSEEECEDDEHISEEHEDAEHVSEEFEDKHISEKHEGNAHLSNPSLQESVCLNSSEDGGGEEVCEPVKNFLPAVGKNTSCSESEALPIKRKDSSSHQDNHHASISQMREYEELKSPTDNTLCDEQPEDADLQAVNESEPSNPEREMDESPCVRILEENVERLPVACEDDVSSLNTQDLSIEVKNEERPKRRKSSRANTPAKHIRRSVACCFDDAVTPTVSRLRPRTPCSRSTRRSLSAHCDSPWELYTPRRCSSARKTPRRSVAKANIPLKETLNTEIEMKENNQQESPQATLGHQSSSIDGEPAIHDSVMLIKKEDSYSPLLTPENTFRREHGMWTVETSPWIERSRKKKKSRKVSGLHGMGDDVPSDGLPLPSHLGISDSVSSVADADVGEDTTCTSLLTLLQPSTTHNTDSPEVDVWGESPSISVLGTPKTSNLQNTIQAEESGDGSMTQNVDMNTKTASMSPSTANALIPCILAPAGNGDEQGVARRGRRKSRKSVMFTIEETENRRTSYKLPGTPVRTSSRVSMGLFPKVDLNIEQPIQEDQDLIVFDSPKSERKTACTRRKSSRISLLPGMTPSPSKEMSVPVSSDLMTWDSPEPWKAPRASVSNLATPLRRSRRLSKVI